uniref:Uncharacterized protein n=1 Tax=Vespula pensylvanica TaxID=30213 RepID=A0A834P666_VESPE|nr:hypothetical protein H0235_006218 [Vespula pensylvanica]
MPGNFKGELARLAYKVASTMSKPLVRAASDFTSAQVFGDLNIEFPRDNPRTFFRFILTQRRLAELSDFLICTIWERNLSFVEYEEDVHRKIPNHENVLDLADHRA